MIRTGGITRAGSMLPVRQIAGPPVPPFQPSLSRGIHEDLVRAAVLAGILRMLV